MESQSLIERSKFESILKRALWLPMVAAFGAAGLFLAEVASLREAAVLVDQSDQIVVAANRTEEIASDAQNGLRNYLTTGEGAFLETYHFGVRHLPNELDHLSRRVAGNAEEVAKVSELKANSLDWIDKTTPLIRSPVPLKNSSAEIALLTKLHLKPLLHELIGYELGVRANRAAAARDLADRALWGGLAIMIIMGGIICWRARVSLIQLVNTYATGLEKMAAGMAAEKKGQQKLEKLNMDLRKAVVTRDEFLSVASHELKTPLTSLKLQMQLAKRSLEREINSDRLGHFLAMGLDQVGRLTKLVDDLLDVTRIESGRLRYTFEWADISEIVKGAIERLACLIRASGSTVTVHFPENPSEPIMAKCDRFRMDQVIVNLMTNALKYGDGAPVDLEVSIQPKTVKISIKDHGIGIADENKDRIFDRFERGINTPNIGGLGIGLYVSRQIVAAHNGNLEVDSKLGCGSTFSVILPIETVPAFVDGRQSPLPNHVNV